MKDAVVSEIGSGRRSSTELAGALDAIRGNLMKVWVIRRAIVLRVQAMGAGGDPMPLLEQAKQWNQVPPGERSDYDIALDEILGFGEFGEIVGDLR